MRLEGQGRGGERGYAMAALLVTLSVMAVTLSIALPVWKTVVQREKESELIFRGEQYARAIALFQRKNGNAFPPNIDTLIAGRFLRRKYVDPITNDEFQILFGSALQGAPGGSGTQRPAPGAGPGGERGQQSPLQRPGGPAAGSPRGSLTGVPTQGSPVTQPTQRGGAGITPRQAGPGVPFGQGVAQGGMAGIAGAPQGIVGVASKSTQEALRVYKGRTKYSEWVFLAQEMTQQPGAVGGAQRPGAPTGVQRPGAATPGRPTVGQPGSRPGLPLDRPSPVPSPTFPRRP